MKKGAVFFCFSFAVAAGFPCASFAQNDAPVEVVRTTVNAESENAEACLEFDKPLSSFPLSKLSAALRLEKDGHAASLPGVAAAHSSLCVFPLDRGKAYRLLFKGLSKDNGDKAALPYSASFAVPDRTPLLAFTGYADENGSLGSYEGPLTLRAVNVFKIRLNVYRVSDVSLMARAWQDRSLTSLAPSESVYLAREKGDAVWHEDLSFSSPLNETAEHPFSLRQKMPNLAPGLYLIAAEAKDAAEENAFKGLSPLAAAWFTNSDFSLRAVRERDSVRVIAANPEKPRDGVFLTAFSDNGEPLAEAKTGSNGSASIQNSKKTSPSGVVGIDKDGHVSFASVEDLTPPPESSLSGAIDAGVLFASPFETVNAVLYPSKDKKTTLAKNPGSLRLSLDGRLYAEYPVPPFSGDFAKLSFPAPPQLGFWSLSWLDNAGSLLAESPLRVTGDPAAPRFDVLLDRSALSADRLCMLSIKSFSLDGKAAPLIKGRVSASWKKLDGAAFGWKDYLFGLPLESSSKSFPVADFLTGPDGSASLSVSLPPPPERGLYQASFEIEGDPDSGIAGTGPILIPLRPDDTLIGLKPLAEGARFSQNGLARFALIALSSDGKARDAQGLSYQIYEKGRRFAWFQNEGRWQYKPEAQLRPAGSGAVRIDADGSSVLEWPVAAGNYRLEILDASGKVLARTSFSAGWDSKNAAAPDHLPLDISFSKPSKRGRDLVARFSLPEPSIVAASASDARQRKLVFQSLPKGKNEISFPLPLDGASSLTLTVDAAPLTQGAHRLRASVPVPLKATQPARAAAAFKTALVADEDPSALILRKNGGRSLFLGVQNTGPDPETFSYSFSASSGLKIDSQREGSFALGGRQSRSLPLFLSGIAEGAKELRLEVKGSQSQRVIRNWPMAVLPKNPFLKSGKTGNVQPRESLLSKRAQPKNESVVFVSAKPADGLAEILSYAFNASPFSTEELALYLNALRLWRDTLDQAGISPDFLTSAREKEILAQLVRHQNPDGGFAPFRGKDSSLAATAAALAALSQDLSARAAPAKNSAAAWLKARLSNTWVDENERADRAAAYAALAAAGAVDAASLHYFSDTSAQTSLPAIAEANVAAAFKSLKEPDAAAFWIKKMLDEHGGQKAPLLLKALAATYALSSDDVLAAAADMGAALRSGTLPDIKDAAALLIAVAANNLDSEKGRIADKNGSLPVLGVVALRAGLASTYVNDGNRPLFVTLTTRADAARTPLPRGASIERRIFRLDGVEAPPDSQLALGEIHLVAIKGEIPDVPKNARLLLQDGANGLKPAGCLFPDKLDTQAALPWLALHDKTLVEACELSPFGLNAVFTPKENGPFSFSAVFLARIDARGSADIPPPRLRLLK